MTQPRRSLIVGFSIFAQGFSPMRKWTFGAGYNQLLFYSLFFNEDQFTLLNSYLIFLGLVFTSQLKAVVRSRKKKKLAWPGYSKLVVDNPGLVPNLKSDMDASKK